MPISLRRRTRRPSPEPAPAPSLGALSLPDLTTPLVDTDHWPPPVPPVPSASASSYPASVGGSSSYHYGGYSAYGSEVGLGLAGVPPGRRDSSSTASLSTSVPKDARLNGAAGQSSFGKPGIGSPWGAKRWTQSATSVRSGHGHEHVRGNHGGSASSAGTTGTVQTHYSTTHQRAAHGGSGHSRGAHGGSGCSAHGQGFGPAVFGECGAACGVPPVPPLPGQVPESVGCSLRDSQSTINLSGLPGMGDSAATLPGLDPYSPSSLSPYSQFSPYGHPALTGSQSFPRSPTIGSSAYPSAESLHAKSRLQQQQQQQQQPAAREPQSRGRAPSLVKDANGASPDFHRPFLQPVASPPKLNTALPGTVSARKRAQKRVAALTIMVAGPTGSGKTSFIEALTSVLDPNRRRLAVRMGPTTSVVRHEVVGTSDRVRRHFVILDTPGLPSNDMVTTPIRGKALNALISILEERQARLLDEETKVVRRKSDGGELVHLVIYVIDARTILTPLAKVDIDWDTVSEPPPCGPSTRPESELLEADPTGVDARLHLDDIEAIRRFSARANVLPILTHVDALTTGELFAVRLAVKRDLATVFGKDPLGGWGILTAGQDFEPFEPGSETPPPFASELSSVSEDADGSSTEGEEEEARIELPYGVFSPEPGLGFNRKFRWGKANASNYKHSDLPHVRDGIICATEWLRTSTREVVYERFRTERLLTAKGVKSLRI